MLVLDTNAIIYHLSGETEVSDFLSLVIQRHEVIIVPTIVAVEFLSFPAVTPVQANQFNIFLSQVQVATLELPVAQLAATIRRENKMHLADATIAATALSYGAILVTRNVRDFRNIKTLRLHKI